MADIPATAISNFLSVLRTLPVWLLAGLAFAGYAVVFTPGFGGIIDPKGSRTEWGIWIWIEAIVFSILTVTRSVIDSGISAYLQHQRNKMGRRALRLVPRHQQCWWHLARQRDDSFVSQISLDVEAANLTDHPVLIVKVRLIRPRSKGEFLHGEVMLPKAGSPYHSTSHAVPPHDTVTASLQIMVRGAIAQQGHPVLATLGITDQYGEVYRRQTDCHPGPTTRDCPRNRWRHEYSVRPARRCSGLRPTAECRRRTCCEIRPPEWLHQGKFEQVDLILNEEKRNYLACGRQRGGLGSLNVGLQSEPNSGWTTVGNAPTLLWDKAAAKPIESPNLTRLVKNPRRIGRSRKGSELEKLSRESPAQWLALRGPRLLYIRRPASHGAEHRCPPRRAILFVWRQRLRI